MNNKEVKPPVLAFGTEQVQLLKFDSQVILCYKLLFFSDTCLPCFFLSLFIYDRTDIYHKANMPFTYAYLTFTLQFTCVRLMANTFLLPI